MGQKFVIVNTEAFSKSGLKAKDFVEFEDLPQIVQSFLRCCPDPFIVLDECSRIKTNTPVAEKKKSTRTRLIKLLSAYGHRMALTGTLMSKSPLNAVDPYQFLTKDAFDEGMFAIAERYCVMMTLPTGRRAARVLLPEHSGKDDRNSWCGLRRRMAKAYAIGGKTRLAISMCKISRELNISYENLWWIITHKKYRPFKDTKSLLKRYEFCTEVVSREEAFDTRLEKYINAPIVRRVKLSEEAKKLYNQLVKLGFTDNIILGKSAALELSQRLMDVCNGFEPISSCLSCEEGAQDGILHNTCPLHAECKRPKATFEPLKENPKLDAVMELVEEIDPEEHQIVIWACRTNFMELLKKTFDDAGIPACCFSGQQTEKEKKDTREGFSNGQYRICIANQQSAAFGVNFMKNCDYTIYACSNASVEQDYQSRHRFLRGETKRLKYAYRIFVEGSVEERIYSALDLGNELIGETNTKEIFALKESL